MAWCHQARSHYLNQCWPRSPTPNGITMPQWVNTGPCHNWFKSSWLKSYEYSLCTNIIFISPIWSHVCTCHDSSAVVTCAKLWLNLVFICHVKLPCIFVRFGSWSHKLLIKQFLDSSHHDKPHYHDSELNRVCENICTVLALLQEPCLCTILALLQEPCLCTVLALLQEPCLCTILALLQEPCLCTILALLQEPCLIGVPLLFSIVWR